MADTLLNRLERDAERIHHGHVEVAECVIARLFKLQCGGYRNEPSAPLDVYVEWAARAGREHERMSNRLLQANLLPKQFGKLGRNGDLLDGVLSLWRLLISAAY
jgi:hypothetical protein